MRKEERKLRSCMLLIYSTHPQPMLEKLSDFDYIVLVYFVAR